jgi:hypothetical protein
MGSSGYRNAVIGLAALFLLGAPSAAYAYTVTVHVHGAGDVTEATSAHLMNCSVGPSGKSNSSVTDCVAGSPTGDYGFGWIVNLQESVPTLAADRGWHFDHWTDGTASHQIDCDDNPAHTGDRSATNCQFQIFDNLYVDLYFADTTGPQDTVINGGPAQGSTTSGTSATFTSFGAASDPDATFQCRLDPPGSVGSFGSCPKNGASFNNLTQNGQWTVTVRAVDPSGNVDTTPATRSWVIDTTPPTTSIGGGPAAGSRTNNTSAGFSLSASEPGSFQCKLAGPAGPGGFASCSSTPAYNSLPDGTYTFSAQATDSVGNLGPASSRTWTVDTQAPDTSIDSGPTGDTNSGSAAFTFSATEPNVTFECMLDTGVWESCASGKSYSSLAEGAHTFYVRGTDPAGNVESSVASRSWNVTSPPADTGGNPPGGNQPGGNQPGGNQPGGTTPADTAGPLAVFSFSKQRLAHVLKKGFASSASSTEAGKLRLDVLYKGKTVATSGNRALGAPGSMKLVAKFSAKWKRKLAHLRSAKVTIRLTATDLVGNKTVKKKTVTLKR